LRSVTEPIYSAGPPDDEFEFSVGNRKFVALLFWCDELLVFDTIVFEQLQPKPDQESSFHWICSGVAAKRFVSVQGKSWKRLADEIGRNL